VRPGPHAIPAACCATHHPLVHYAHACWIGLWQQALVVRIEAASRDVLLCCAVLCCVLPPPAAVADHQLAPGTPGAASVSGGVDGCGGSASGSVADEGGEALRREWEALLEAAARCKDARQQPQMLTR
jgi:hypothetical protein